MPQDKQVEALIAFVEAIKPYHSKILEVETVYSGDELAQASIVERLLINGTDYTN